MLRLLCVVFSNAELIVCYIQASQAHQCYLYSVIPSLLYDAFGHTEHFIVFFHSPNRPITVFSSGHTQQYKNWLQNSHLYGREMWNTLCSILWRSVHQTSELRVSLFCPCERHSETRPQTVGEPSQHREYLRRWEPDAESSPERHDHGLTIP